MKKMKEKDQSLVVVDGDNIFSVNERSRLKDIRKKFPNIEVIIGKSTPDDKPIRIDLTELESDRIKIFDAATESILGKRIDRLKKPRKEPVFAYAIIFSFLAGIGACYFVFNI